MSHTHDEQEIRHLIDDWMDAIRNRDLDAVLAHHADDIVMFDVPPPQVGIRGMDEYAATWSASFEFIGSGAVFEIVDLDVTAGTDVAYAVALVRCGSPAELRELPDKRLRLSLGLVKRTGQWVVQHEHHSFCDERDRYAGEEAVHRIHQEWSAHTEAKRLDGIMSHIDPDIVSYEHETPIEHVSSDAVREVCRSGLEQTTGHVTWDVPDLQVVARDDLAVAWGLNRMTATMPDGSVTETWSRGTRVFRRQGDEWLAVHQHVSYPRDPDTGMAVESAPAAQG